MLIIFNVAVANTDCSGPAHQYTLPIDKGDARWSDSTVIVGLDPALGVVHGRFPGLVVACIIA